MTFSADKWLALKVLIGLFALGLSAVVFSEEGTSFTKASHKFSSGVVAGGDGKNAVSAELESIVEETHTGTIWKKIRFRLLRADACCDPVQQKEGQC